MTVATTTGPNPPVLTGRAPCAWMYHSVADPAEDPYDVTVSPARLDAQLRWLTRRGLRGVSLGEALAAAGTPAARRMVALTFDDGYEDFMTEVLPLLDRHRCTATAFVLAGKFGGDNEWDRPGPNKPLMTRRQVRLAEAAGVEIGSHGLRHVRLTRADDDTLVREVRRSRTILADLLGHDIAGFCYPYGDRDARVTRAVREAGYTYAAATGHAAPGDPYTIPRIFIADRDTAWRLRAKAVRHRLRWG